MLKICKNMQNIQNMHSCFKNAALCSSKLSSLKHFLVPELASQDLVPLEFVAAPRSSDLVPYPNLGRF